MATKDSERCWPGYEPVKGKKEHEQGSCRKKAESKMTPSEKEFVRKRQEQIHSGDKGKSGPPEDPEKVKKQAGKERAAAKKAA
jgi:hypothetical protein